ncbi:MAG: hypothetical protein AB7G80_06105 [Dongiaceae bacterium]
MASDRRKNLSRRASYVLTRKLALSAEALDTDKASYIGICRIIDIEPTFFIRPAHVSPYLFGLAPRVLLRTRAKNIKIYPVLMPETIDLLHVSGVRVIGIDTPSIDAPASVDKTAYTRIAEYGMAILTNLELGSMPMGDYELMALAAPQSAIEKSTPSRAILKPLAA